MFSSSLTTALVLFVVLIVLLAKSIKIAGENERFALFILGRFAGYRGPGVIPIAPFIYEAHRIKVGDIGVMTSSEFARIGDVELPVTNTNSLHSGQAVRVDGFDGTEPRLVASNAQPTNQCPKCGHEF